jgi:PAS domain S-box-containing protein
MHITEVVPLIRGVTKQTSIPSSALHSERRMLLELFFPQSPASAPKRYAFAAACCAVLFASRLLLDPLLGETVPLLFFTLAVVVSAIRGGFGPGIFATVLGVCFVIYFFPPKGVFLIARESLPAAARELAVFFVVGVIVSWLGSKLRDLRWQALELAAQRNEILESITDGFAALDADRRFVYLNKAAEQLMQRPRDETVGKSLWGEAPALRGSLIEDMFRQVLNERVAVHFEYLSPLSNRWLEIHIYPAQNSGLTVYFRDVSDRKLMESHLRETLAERNAALERVRLLSGLLPICAACKKIQDDEGNWQQIESYISRHSQAKFSHGMCPDCGKQYYGELWPPTSK